ncbi:MFS transporter [Clostridiaceae bacterium NSJ-31]|uniref:MFS transporter n=2 Tax=Ligaoa zhengdingensis TaxID=2763658 RepID=A0A926DVB2_9FIRM|nr:MFS transporter [Ligaoa zhengdingensis]MBC8545950.1 MFS transporter [Ligaoa zhengdingensis]
MTSFLKTAIKRENIGFTLVQSLYQFGFCCYNNFLVLYLQEHGFTNTECGLTITLQAVITLALQPVYGYITDTYLSCKKFLMLATALSIPAALLLPATVKTVPLAMLSVVVYSAFFNTNSAIIDAWELLLRDERPYIRFELTRGMASFFYAFFILGFGALMEHFGTRMMFFSYGLVASALIVGCLVIPGVPCCNGPRSGAASIGTLQALGLLARQKRYVLFLLSGLCFNIALRSTMTFLPNYVALFQQGSGMLALLLCTTALAEMPTLNLLGRINRKSRVEYSGLIVLSSMLCNLLILHHLSSAEGLILAMVFRGIAHIGFLGVSMEFICQNTPRQLNSTAITLGSACTIYLGSIIGSWLGGVLIDSMGLPALTLFAIIFLLLALLSYLPLLRQKNA